MTRRRENNNNLVAKLVLIKRLIGIGAVLAIFYLTIPWRFIQTVTSNQDVTTEVFVTAVSEWAIGFADNILLIVLLAFIAILTYGPEALDLIFGPNEPKRPPY